MARDDLEEWDPKTGTSKPSKPNPVRPGGGGGSPGGGGVNIPIGPGGYMKGSRPPQYRKGGPVFEKSKKDVEPRGMKEGSPKEEAFDRKQAMPRFQEGGYVTKGQGEGEDDRYDNYMIQKQRDAAKSGKPQSKPIINPTQAMPGFTAKQMPEKEYASGGMVKHGSSTRVSCKGK